MRSDGYDLNIKVVPLSDVELSMPKTHSLEAISFSFYVMPKSGVNNTGGVAIAYSRIRTWLGRNGETMSSSCSWGANQLGRNGMRHHVHWEGLDGTAYGNEAWRTTERRKRTCV